MVLKGLIAAAGRSRRMNGFKPLMKLNGFPMIRMTVDSLKNAGIRDITVVTGYRVEEMAEVLRPLSVRVVENTAYAETDMLHSIRLGLRHLLDADGVFFLPGDVPLAAPGSLARLKAYLAAADPGVQVLQPVKEEKGRETFGDLKEEYRGAQPAFRAGHPPVLLAGAYEPIFSYDGDGGLGGIFRTLNVKRIWLEDPGILTDADYPDDFAGLRAYAREHKGVSREVCEAFYRAAGLAEMRRAWGRSLGEAAGYLAEKLTESGVCLDIELCRSGGYLRALDRSFSGGEAAERNFLQNLGYRRLSEAAAGPDPAGKTGAADKEKAVIRLAETWVCGRKDGSGERLSAADFRRLKKEFEVMTGERL